MKGVRSKSFLFHGVMKTHSYKYLNRSPRIPIYSQSNWCWCYAKGYFITRWPRHGPEYEEAMAKCKWLKQADLSVCSVSPFVRMDDGLGASSPARTPERQWFRSVVFFAHGHQATRPHAYYITISRYTTKFWSRKTGYSGCSGYRILHSFRREKGYYTYICIYFDIIHTYFGGDRRYFLDPLVFGQSHLFGVFMCIQVQAKSAKGPTSRSFDPGQPFRIRYWALWRSGIRQIW